MEFLSPEAKFDIPKHIYENLKCSLLPISGALKPLPAMKICIKNASAACKCYFGIYTNSVDPDPTASREAV